MTVVAHYRSKVKHFTDPCPGATLWAVARKNVNVPGRAEQQAPITVHQVVAYNFRRIREMYGWTQSYASQRLEPFLGYKLRQAGVSAIERTLDGDRTRNLDVSEVIAFAQCFQVHLGWFFMPPPDMVDRPIEVLGQDEYDRPLAAAYLLEPVVGRQPPWQQFVDRLGELINLDDERLADLVHRAVYDTFGGWPSRETEEQMDIRRRMLLAVKLSRLMTPEDDYVQEMAKVLQQLLALSPGGWGRMRDKDPEEAMRLLAEIEDEKDTMIKSNVTDEDRQDDPFASRGDFRRMKRIDERAAVGLPPLDAEDY